MKRYSKIQSVTKSDVFRQSADQANLNTIYRSLRELIDAMNGLSNEKFDELGLVDFYKEVIDWHQDLYKYYRG